MKLKRFLAMLLALLTALLSLYIPVKADKSSEGDIHTTNPLPRSKFTPPKIPSQDLGVDKILKDMEELKKTGAYSYSGNKSSKYFSKDNINKYAHQEYDLSDGVLTLPCISPTFFKAFPENRKYYLNGVGCKKPTDADIKRVLQGDKMKAIAKDKYITRYPIYQAGAVLSPDDWKEHYIKKYRSAQEQDRLNKFVDNVFKTVNKVIGEGNIPVSPDIIIASAINETGFHPSNGAVAKKNNWFGIACYNGKGLGACKKFKDDEDNIRQFIDIMKCFSNTISIYSSGSKCSRKPHQYGDTLLGTNVGYAGITACGSDGFSGEMSAPYSKSVSMSKIFHGVLKRANKESEFESKFSEDCKIAE